MKNDKVPDLDILEYDKLHAVLARGTALVTRAVSKVMINQTERVIAYRNGPKNLGRGVIVNVASAFSLLGGIGRLPYISAKHAVMGIVKASG